MASNDVKYAPDVFGPLTFHDQRQKFFDCADSPTAYLERCLETISQREPEIKAWEAMDVELARKSAEESTARYRAGKPLSSIDGMPTGIKDLIMVRGFPTTKGIPGNAAISSADSPCVQALREAGAIVLGKLVTTQLGGGTSSATRNPFDAGHTPGGSSSGSAAAIGARMLPAAIGSQAAGSIIRPAGYCGNYALKPTCGAIHRGETIGTSIACIGVHAGSIEDVWRVTYEICKRTGGDPGGPGLFGPEDLPVARAPSRVIVMETAGWAITDPDTKHAFERVLEALRERGVKVIRRGDDAAVEDFERSIADASAWVKTILGFEGRWNLENCARQFDTLSSVTKAFLEHARTITVPDYRRVLESQLTAQRHFAALSGVGDIVISPTAPGPAPSLERAKEREGTFQMETGDPVFNAPGSLLLAPAVAVPLMAVRGLPVGIQLMGQQHSDYRVLEFAQWMSQNLRAVVV